MFISLIMSLHKLVLTEGKLRATMWKTTVGAGYMQEEEPLIVEEVAKRLRVSPETVRAWIRSGELEAIDVGKYLIYPSALEDFKKRRRTGRKRDNKDS